MSESADLGAVIAGLFPPGVGCHYSARLPATAELWPAELTATGGMVPARLDEFTHGRHCVRAALAGLGVAAAAIHKGPDRAPLWPAGITGSITHTGAAAAAVVARTTDFASLGLDIETDTPLTRELIAMICRPEETPGADGIHAKLLFSIKEAIYKCLYPVVRKYIDFLEMEVILDYDNGKFRAVSHAAQCPTELSARLQGRFAVRSGYVISATWLK